MSYDKHVYVGWYVDILEPPMITTEGPRSCTNCKRASTTRFCGNCGKPTTVGETVGKATLFDILGEAYDDDFYNPLDDDRDARVIAISNDVRDDLVDDFEYAGGYCAMDTIPPMPDKFHGLRKLLDDKSIKHELHYGVVIYWS